MTIDRRASRVDVRLTTSERAIVAQLQALLATPLLPRVNASDILRAGLRELHARLGARGATQ
jgi:hypothetical protein